MKNPPFGSTPTVPSKYSADRLTLLKGPQIPSLSECRIEKGTQIRRRTFENYTALHPIKIPDFVTEIGEGAFPCDLFVSPKISN